MKRVKHEQHDPEWYLANPRTRKWMVQCPACNRWGYRSDAPADGFGRSQLEHYFEAIDIDNGLCSNCRQVGDD